MSEITGMEGEVIQMHEIYRFVKEHTDEKGNIHGSFRATGTQTGFPDRIESVRHRAAGKSLRSIAAVVRGLGWASYGLSMRSCSGRRC